MKVALEAVVRAPPPVSEAATEVDRAAPEAGQIKPDAKLFFEISGFMVAIVVADSLVTHWQQNVLTSQWLVVGASVPLFALASVLATLPPRAPRPLIAIAEITRILLACGYVWTGTWLALSAHRSLVAAIALVQALLIYAFMRRNAVRLPALALAAAAFVSWAAAVPLTYTAFANLLLDGATSSNFVALALPGALLLAVSELTRANPERKKRASRASLVLLVFVGLAFLEFSLRSDGLFTDWIPYHRSYFTEPATAVRLGHWLLWDIPSQYGFFAIVAIALAPGATTWQATYLLTAAILTAECLMYFAMLRRAAGGVRNVVLAVLLPAAMFLGDQAYRYPFGPRVYPQHGIRFVWVFALMFVIFQRSTFSTGTRRRAWTGIGYAVATLGCLWSFESAFWSALIWMTYVGTEACLASLRRSTLSARSTALLPVLVLPALLAICVGTIDLYYRLRLGVLPDWRAYAEFSTIYLGAAPNSPLTDTLGSGWFLLLLLAGIATPSFVALAERRWAALPPLFACWIATWSTSIYFAGEPFANHVNALLGIFGFAFAIVARVARNEGLAPAPVMIAQTSFLPVIIILIATTFGNGGALSKMQAPFWPGYRFEQTNGIAPIAGELASLMRQAGIGAEDKVVLPDDIGWVKTDVGLTLPFVREANGGLRELRPWLPVGPGGGFAMYDTLTPDRRGIYIERFLGVGREAGWLITFHEPARCSVFAPQTENRGLWTSANYSATRCVLRARAARL